MSAILPYRNCFYKWTKYNSKQSHDTTAILISLWCALRLDQLFSTIYEKLNIWHFYEVSVVRLWWTSENHVSRYLFLEQIAHFLEGVLTFLRKAGDLIQRFSESTHIDVLNKTCKMMKVRKKLNSFSSTVEGLRDDAVRGTTITTYLLLHPMLGPPIYGSSDTINDKVHSSIASKNLPITLRAVHH